MTSATVSEKCDFNSHTREGVTQRFSFLSYVVFYFNSHTREGVTRADAAGAQSHKFQLTHP